MLRDIGIGLAFAIPMGMVLCGVKESEQTRAAFFYCAFLTMIGDTIIYSLLK